MSVSEMSPEPGDCPESKREAASVLEKGGFVMANPKSGVFVSGMAHRKVPKVSLVDMTVEVMREGLRSGRWRSRMPGQLKLAKELGVSRKTLAAAIARLVEEGVISASGERKAVAVPEAPTRARSRSLRVAVLILQPMEDLAAEARQGLQDLLMELHLDGHVGRLVSYPKGKDTHKTGYLPRLVEEAAVDAWLIHNGTVEVLKWFAGSGVPVMAMGGRIQDIPIAGVGTGVKAFVPTVVRRLVGLGHRRIVLISPRAWRLPEPASTIVEFRRELEAAGIRPSEYHTPDWEETPEGLFKLLDELFRVTPPTAVLCWAMNTPYGVQSWLKGRGLRIPEDVSIVSIWDDGVYAWYSPGLRIACMESSDEAVRRRMRDWLRGVAAGKNDLTQHLVKPELDEGNSIGPAKTR